MHCKAISCCQQIFADVTQRCAVCIYIYISRTAVTRAFLYVELEFTMRVDLACKRNQRENVRWPPLGEFTAISRRCFPSRSFQFDIKRRRDTWKCTAQVIKMHRKLSILPEMWWKVSFYKIVANNCFFSSPSVDSWFCELFFTPSFARS